jgi:curved DNA-binding protein CbpA
MTTAKESLYETLEVSPRASAGVIKAAYRCLVQMHHPDKHGGHPSAVDKLARINHAYAILSNPAQRAKYDAAVGTGAPDTDRRGASATRATRATSPATVPAKRGGSRAFAFRPLTDPPNRR